INGELQRIQTISRYFPIWRMGKDRLPSILSELKEELVGSSILDGLCVTMTAELSDVYESKRVGVEHILDCVDSVFFGANIKVIDVYSGLRSVSDAKRDYLSVAGANWAATAWLISQYIPTCILIDVGSTTTDIIPIMNGKIAAKGLTDLERLASGELIYTGALRTNIATIVDEIPVRGKMVRVSSELFALSGDVHLILGNIGEEDYVTETADGRGRSKREALARLSRVVCADSDMLDVMDLEKIARYIYEEQLNVVSKGLLQVLSGIEMGFDVPIVTVGLGGKFIGAKAAERIGLKKIVDLAEILGKDNSRAISALATGLRMAFEYGVKLPRWL
ncbi:MAG: hypothetical protein NZ896_03670, partial [Nitrososphaerales archaeon]|nr:hypothetical protein [Nitrososphaerales archaeon]